MSSSTDSLIPILWALGTVLLLSRLVMAHLAARGIVRRSSSSIVNGVTAPVRTSAEIDLPFTYGLRNPVIVLPATASAWSPAQLEATLIHEQAHADRRDGIGLLLSQTILALYWWHPMVWYATRAAAAERERACDDAVIRHGMRASQYGQCLLAQATEAAAWGTAPLATAMFGHSAGLGARVAAILDPSVDRSSGRRPRLPVIAAVAGFVCLIGAAAPRPLRDIVSGELRISNAATREPSHGAGFPESRSATAPGVISAQPARVLSAIAASMVPVSHPTEEAPLATICQQARDSRRAKTYSDRSVRITGAGSTFNDGVMRQIWTGTDCIAWMEYSGSVTASMDERTIDVGSGGRFIAHEEGPDGVREYSTSPRMTSFTVNGATVPIGPDEQAWIAAMSREFLRRSGMRARARALNALSKGVQGLLAEASALPRTQLRVDYLDEGFSTLRNPAEVVSFIHEGAALLDSSEARGRFLLNVPAKWATDVKVLVAIFEEASVIEPDQPVEDVLATFTPPRPLPASLAPFVDRMIAGMQTVERRTMLRAYYMDVRP
jgi:hypothetical protein